jgi:hypothetical protein
MLGRDDFRLTIHIKITASKYSPDGTKLTDTEEAQVEKRILVPGSGNYQRTDGCPTKSHSRKRYWLVRAISEILVSHFPKSIGCEAWASSSIAPMAR